jgi:AcrR family transcriptional regulator
MAKPTTEPRVPNRRGEGARLREDILRAAGNILEASGSDDAVTLRGVARLAGVTAPAIYAHFTDRYDILRTVVESTFAQLATALQEGADTQTEPVPRLQAVCRAYLTFAAERPHHYRVLFERHRTAETNVNGTNMANTDVRTMVGADAFGVLLKATAACIRSGASQDRDPVATTTRVWIGLHGQATLQASLPWHPWPDRDELANDIMMRLADLV